MKILVPTDFSKNAHKAVDYAIRFADRTGAEIILLHAYQVIKTDFKTRWAFFEEYNRSVARKLHDELKVVKRKIGRINPAIRVSAEFFEDDIKTSVVKAASEWKADLIVMGTQGASGIKKGFYG